MEKTKNIVAIALLFSTVVVGSEGYSLPESITVPVTCPEGRNVQQVLNDAEVDTTLDADSATAAGTNAGTLGAVLRDASHPHPSSILRAVDRERIANGKCPLDNLMVVEPTPEQIAAAAAYQANREAAKAAKRGGNYPTTSYLDLPGGAFYKRS
jgi:hypothetical protein